MKHFPKTALISAVLGLLLFAAGDLYNSAGFLVCVLGGLLLLFAWLRGIAYFSRQKSLKIRKITKIVKAFTFAAILLFLISFIWVESLILTHDGGTETPTAQTLVVLGAGLHGDQPSLTLIARLQTALDYLEENPSAVAVVTGGQGTYETCTEALAMALWLTQRGVAPRRVYREEQATDTRENLAFSRAIIEAQGLPQPVAVVSNSFHLYRAERLALQAGFEEVQTLSAPVPDVPLQWLSVSVYLREYCSILLMFLQNIL